MDMPHIADKNEAKLALRSLTSHLGWYVLREFLEKNAAEIAASLLDPANELSDDDKKVLTLKRYYQLKLLELPEELIKVYDKTEEGVIHNPISLDPYDLI